MSAKEMIQRVRDTRSAMIDRVKIMEAESSVLAAKSEQAWADVQLLTRLIEALEEE